MGPSQQAHPHGRINDAANADDHKTALNHQLIDSLKAELDKVKTDLNDELDKLEKAKADIGAFWQQREVRRPKL